MINEHFSLNAFQLLLFRLNFDEALFITVKELKPCLRRRHKYLRHDSRSRIINKTSNAGFKSNINEMLININFHALKIYLRSCSQQIKIYQITNFQCKHLPTKSRRTIISNANICVAGFAVKNFFLFSPISSLPP